MFYTMSKEIASTELTLEEQLQQSQQKNDGANLLEARPLSSFTNPSSTTADSISAHPHIPSISASAVLGESDSMPAGSIECRGREFDSGNTEDDMKNNIGTDNRTKPDDNNDSIECLLRTFRTTGFQATNLSLAMEEIQRMRQWRLSDVDWQEGVDDETLQDPALRRRIRARLFLAYTSNQISCGQREVLKYIVQHKMVDVLVTTAGGIEEDLIKCMRPTYMGDFKLSGRDLRKRGINRIGNLLVPNRNYCEFEDWITPILHKMHDEQDVAALQWVKEMTNYNPDVDDCMPTKFQWTPSAVIHRLGLEINHPDSVLYWAAKNNIPVFCPALTDGSIGDMMYFHSYKRPGFVLDIAGDIRRINDLAVQSHCTGQIIIGGGVVKHHTCNANLMRNGADYSVYINTANEFDGSDSGASPDEAISWGKIRLTARPVKVCCDATIAFPLLVSQTFAKNVREWKESVKDTLCWVGDLQE